MRVAMLVTCVVDALAPTVAEATTQVLAAGGCDVTCPRDQACCGQPAWNAGFAADAARAATPTLAALDAALADGAEAIVVPSGSCAAMVRRSWPELFAAEGSAAQAAAAQRVADRTWELTELVAHLDLPTLAAPAEDGGRLDVAWHHGCHLLRELHHADAPRVLDAIAGCDAHEWSAADRCCGFGGLFSVKQPETSVAMADHKLATLTEEAPGALLVSADLSCLLHLAGRAAETGVDVRVRHVAEVLADALPAPEERR